jgi:hypothetical protein
MLNKIYYSIIIFCLAFCTNALGQPANDNCASAIALTVGAACVSGTTASATLQGGEATGWCGSAPQQSVWYSFVATATEMDVWVDNSQSPYTCELASAVWNTSTCIPSGTPTWYKAIASPTDVWHHLTGLTISNTYLIQICYRTTGGTCGGAGGYQTFCIGVYAPPTTAGYTHPSGPLEPGVSLGSCVVMTTGGQYYDDGGSGSNHGNSYTGLFRVFCPATINNCMRATINYVNMTPSADYLRIINSSCRNGTILADLSMATPGTQYTSTDSSGCLAFRIYADGSTNRAGWNITLAEVPCSVGPNGTAPQDASTALAICSASSYTGNSTGPGLVVQSCGTCDLSENHSVWYKFKIATAGTLEFTIDPQDNNDDYDFVLWGPTADPANLGAARRCSYAYDAANGNTGLRSSETDNSENSSGNAWVDTMYVNAGDQYYLMLNRTDDDSDPLADGFGISFSSSTCTFDCDFVALPVDLVLYDVAADMEQNGTTIRWATASEINNHYFNIERSRDGQNFESIMTVNGSGNTTTTHHYYAFDPYPETGTNYYRLSQVDFDGATTVYGIKSAKFEPEDVVNLYPVPVKGNKFFVRTNSEVSSPDVELYNMTGRTIPLSLKSGSSTDVLEVEVANGAALAGVYNIRIIYRGQTINRKIVFSE